MKKTILLLATVLLTTATFAQFNDKQKMDRDVAYNKGYDKGYDDRFDKDRGKAYFFTAKERDMQIAQITREYARQIQVVKSKFFMSRMVKQRQVQLLEQKRDREISQVWAKYNDKNNKGDGRGGKGRGKW